MHEPEPLPAIVRMRVINPKAPHAGETGWVVKLDQRDTLLYIDLQFHEDGTPVRYERQELELCQM